MTLSVLGPVRLEGPDGPVPVPGRKAREALTLLALAAPRPLSLQSLTSSLWDDPPPAASKTVQAHLSRIRSALVSAGSTAELQGGPAGYRLVVTPSALDVAHVRELRRLARLATAAGDAEGARTLLARAREVWRGDAELPHTTDGDAERTRLVEEGLALVEDHLAATVAAGVSADAVAELESFTARHPLRERGWELLIEALYRCARQADALEAYRRVRRVLRDEVGVDPGPGLRRLAQAVLTHSVPTLPVVSGPTTHPRGLQPRYVDVDGVHVAYVVLGDGPVDLLLLNPTFIPVDAYLEEPHLAGAVLALGRGRRLIAFDRRGLGLSDPLTSAAPPRIQDWARDAVAVLDAAGGDRVHVVGNADTSLIALVLAADHPERVATLTLVNGYARATAAEDYPHGLDRSDISERLRAVHTPGPAAALDVLRWRLPAVADDPRFRAWWDVIGRRGASPRTAAAVHASLVDADVRPYLTRVVAPVLLLARHGCASYDPGHARYLADTLTDATLHDVDDPNDAWFVGDVDWVIRELEAFMAVER